MTQIQLQQLMQENQELRDEKVRIMDVNTILERKVQVERSEVMSIRNDFETALQFNDTGSMTPKQLKNFGKMSFHARKQTSEIMSMRGSAKSSAYSSYSKQSMFRPKRLGMKKESQMDKESYKESYKEKMFMKYQTKKNIGNQSQYKSNMQMDTCSEGYQFDGQSNKDVIVNDDQSSDSSFMQRLAPSERSSIRGSVKSKNKNRNRPVQVVDDMDSDESI